MSWSLLSFGRSIVAKGGRPSGLEGLFGGVAYPCNQPHSNHVISGVRVRRVGLVAAEVTYKWRILGPSLFVSACVLTPFLFVKLPETQVFLVFALFVDQMAGKKGMIASDDLGSLRPCYHFPNSIELSAPREGDSLWNHRDGSICLNEWMFKAGVSTNSWKVVQLVMWFCERKKCKADRHFWVSLLSRKVMLGCVTFAGKRNMKIVSNVLDSWSEGLPEVECIAPEELEAGQRMVPEFFQSHNQRWGLPFFGALAASSREELEGCRVPQRMPVLRLGALPALVPRRLDHRACAEECPKKKSLATQGRNRRPWMRRKSVWRGRKRQAFRSNWLSREEARRSGLIVASLEASEGPAPSGLVPSFVLIVDVEGNVMSPVPAFERESSKASGREDTEVGVIKDQGPVPHRCVDSREAGASVRCGILGTTLGEASSCTVNDKLFRRPFDMEARVLKILVKEEGVGGWNALGLTPSLDKEGRESVERMLLEFLPDVWRELSEVEERIHLIDGCVSRVKYCYHVLRESVRLSVGCPRARDQFETNCIMSEEERRKVIAVGKRPKEAGVAQVAREVLRSGSSSPSAWQYLEESLTGIVFEACRMAGEEPGAELDRRRAEAADALRFSFELGAAKIEVATLRDRVVSLDAKEAELSSKLESSQVRVRELGADVDNRFKASAGRGFTQLVADPGGLPVPLVNAFLVPCGEFETGGRAVRLRMASYVGAMLRGSTFLILERKPCPSKGEGDRSLNRGGVSLVGGGWRPQQQVLGASPLRLMSAPKEGIDGAIGIIKCSPKEGIDGAIGIIKCSMDHDAVRLRRSADVDLTRWQRRGSTPSLHGNMLVETTLQDISLASICKLRAVFPGTVGFSAEVATSLVVTPIRRGAHIRPMHSCACGKGVPLMQ
ncbi:hypothetical protein ACLOJK_034222 [Asimina triloba]